MHGSNGWRNGCMEVMHGCMEVMLGGIEAGGMEGGMGI